MFVYSSDISSVYFNFCIQCKTYIIVVMLYLWVNYAILERGYVLFANSVNCFVHGNRISLFILNSLIEVFVAMVRLASKRRHDDARGKQMFVTCACACCFFPSDSKLANRRYIKVLLSVQYIIIEIRQISV